MLSLRSAVVAGLAVVSSVAVADEADPVVARIGERVLKASDVTRRLASLPKYRLAAFGSSPADIRRHFVETVLVPELRYSAEGDRLRLEARPEVVSRIRDAKSRALVDQIRKESAAESVSEEDVNGYFASHRDEYEKPERLRIARILTEDEALAQKVLAEARGVGGPERWTKLAREHSVDEATKMRGGSLGFVFPDGRTEVPQLRVDPALYSAASGVKDGELVAQPIREGNRFAVVWRRGTLPKSNRTIADERQPIREILQRKRAEENLRSILEDLRKKYVSNVTPELLEVPLPGEAPSSGPSAAPRGSNSADPVPKPTDRGLR